METIGVNSIFFNEMDRFFASPTPERVASYIYNQVVLVHETGGRGYRYSIPDGLSISFVHEVIDRLGKHLTDADVVIETIGRSIVIDWS